MSRPPDKSWMLATLIASSAQAEEENIPAAAAVAAVLCKNSLRFTVIVVPPWVVDTLRDKIFFQDRRAHCVFRIDHIAEPDASGLTQQHVGVDFIEPVLLAHPAHEFAIGDAGSVFERTCATDRHQKILGFKPRPGE